MLPIALVVTMVAAQACFLVNQRENSNCRASTIHGSDGWNGLHEIACTQRCARQVAIRTRQDKIFSQTGFCCQFVDLIGRCELHRTFVQETNRSDDTRTWIIHAPCRGARNPPPPAPIAPSPTLLPTEAPTPWPTQAPTPWPTQAPTPFQWTDRCRSDQPPDFTPAEGCKRCKRGLRSVGGVCLRVWVREDLGEKGCPHPNMPASPACCAEAHRRNGNRWECKTTQRCNEDGICYRRAVGRPRTGMTFVLYQEANEEDEEDSTGGFYFDLVPSVDQLESLERHVQRPRFAP